MAGSNLNSKDMAGSSLNSKDTAGGKQPQLESYGGRELGQKIWREKSSDPPPAAGRRMLS